MKKTLNFILLLIILTVSLSACQANCQIELTKDGDAIGQITQDDFSFYLDKVDEEDDEIGTISLGQFLYINGLTLVDQVTFIDKDGKETTFVWDEIALDTILINKGKIIVNGEEYAPVSIDITESPLVSEITYAIIDIAPTMAYNLGLPELIQASGNILVEGSADYGVMILVDGFQYQKLQSMISAGELPYLGMLDEIRQGLTVYPPVTVSSTAALLTGALPQVNGVYGHGYRSTELTTLFDLAVQEGRTVIAVEGASLPFNLRNAETTLSGDRDENGYSDDNVLVNALEVINNDMPDLLYIHFHEIDDMGHGFGPESEEYELAAIRVDEYLAQIYAAVPTGSFIAIFADHGMHAEEEGGNHGSLIESDLVIPIIFLWK